MRINLPVGCLNCICFVLVLIVGISGCSGNKRKVVYGTITLDGRPLSPCIVRFHGANGYLTTALLQDDGKFSMTDVIPGEYKVTIKIDEAVGAGTPEPGSGGKRKRPQPAGKGAASRIPAKYLNPTTTDLIFTITPDTDQLAIHLE
jgi:hypothetical protein